MHRYQWKSQASCQARVAFISSSTKLTLAGTFEFRGGTFVSTCIKMGETSFLRVVVQSDGKFCGHAQVKVTIGGCGE